jgi:hypothetical protein
MCASLSTIRLTVNFGPRSICYEMIMRAAAKKYLVRARSSRRRETQEQTLDQCCFIWYLKLMNLNELDMRKIN